jgi:RimJ/RimL family protein N-acetyltransferase
MQEGDFDELLRIFTDPKVMASFGGELFSREQMQRWLHRNLDHQTQYGYGLYSVILKSNNAFIGDCGLEVIQVDGATVAELGYDFHSNSWHHGYATEAAIAVRDYAFGTLGLTQLISLIRIGNDASRRVAERVGMHLDSEFEQYGNHYWKFVRVRDTP